MKNEVPSVSHFGLEKTSEKWVHKDDRKTYDLKSGAVFQPPLADSFTHILEIRARKKKQKDKWLESISGGPFRRRPPPRRWIFSVEPIEGGR